MPVDARRATPATARGEKFRREFRTADTSATSVFVIGPVTGATVAAAYYKVINAMQDKEAENEPAADGPRRHRREARRGLRVS